MSAHLKPTQGQALPVARPQSAVTTPTAKPIARPQSSSSKSTAAARAQSPAKQQQQQQPAHVYTLGSFTVKHDADALESGAWLFDDSQVPSWMESQLPKHAISAQQTKRGVSATPAKPASGNKVAVQAPAKQQVQQVQPKQPEHVYKLGECKVTAQVDAFESGAWLWEPSAQQGVGRNAAARPVVQQQAQQRVSSPSRRPQSPRK